MREARKTIWVNFWGGPGSGKSTGAAWVFSRLKTIGVEAELVAEYAKDMVWEKNPLFKEERDFQMMVSAEQLYRMLRVDGKVDVAVSDSPLPLGGFYAEGTLACEEFRSILWKLNERYDSIDFFIERVKSYNPNGRNQEEAEANEISRKIKEMLNSKGVPFTCVPGSDNGYQTIVEAVLRKLEDGGRS